MTGGAHSIGFAIGCGLAQAGATICFNCTNEDSRARGVANYAAEGITAYGYVADVTSEEQMNALVAQIRQEHGIIDILVNNAGIIKRIPMLDMSVEDFRKVLHSKSQYHFHKTQICLCLSPGQGSSMAPCCL